MALVKGNPMMIVLLFFGAAVLSMGGVYAVATALIVHFSMALMLVLVGLCGSLVLSLLIVGRTFWVTAKVSRRPSHGNRL